VLRVLKEHRVQVKGPKVQQV